jgi:hypothetical protein
MEDAVVVERWSAASRVAQGRARAMVTVVPPWNDGVEPIVAAGELDDDQNATRA